MRPSRDAWLAAALAVVGQLDIWVAGNIEGSPAVTVPASLLLATAVGLRRTAPQGALALAIAALAAQDLLAEPAEGLSTILAILIMAYSVATELRLAAAAAAGAALLGATWAAVALGGPAALGDYLFTGLIVAIPWAIGRSARRAAREHGARLERERRRHADQAVASERARIARELHDVVAHGVSVMVVHAGALRQARGVDGRETEALEAIEAAGREALSELRRMLQVLRADDADDGLAPQPGFGDLESLVEGFSATGLPVQLFLDGADGSGSGIELTVYRIVQEALTNVLKHGREVSCVRVHVAQEGDVLRVEVQNDGASVGARGEGHGLIGMRERAALYGGELEADPNLEGGWRVRVTFPLVVAS